MMNKNRFFSLTSVTMMLICSCACAEESSTKMETKKPADKTIAQNGNTKPAATGPVQPKDPKDEPISQADVVRVSEAFGNFVGRNLKSPGINFDLDSIIKGMRDGYAGKPAPMSDKEYETLMAKIQQQAYKKLSEENLKAANEFLAKNAKADKVVVLEPGKLEYTIVKEGNGAVVKEHDSPQIQYEGKFLDGKTFGSSKDTGGPITVPLDQTIPGFSKGIVGMKEGEKRTLWVHPDVGYGTTGHMPPNSLLIFDIEVVKANAPEPLSLDDDEDLSDDLSFGDDDMDDDDDMEDGSLVSSPTGVKGTGPAKPKS